MRSRSAPARTSRDEATTTLLIDATDDTDLTDPSHPSRLRPPHGLTTSSSPFTDPRFGIGTYRRRDPCDGEEEDEENPVPVYHDPIDVPVPTEEEMRVKRDYRIGEEGMKRVKWILGMFRGTHNFHNFIPGARYDDSRCFIRILNVECSEPELHHGMEWIRIKIQSRAFARYMIRRMISLTILVLRTNTPRTLVSNAFSLHPIQIPTSPPHTLIFDTPFYLAYNSQIALSPRTRVSFDEVGEEVETFRREGVHEWVYGVEAREM
ncbi:tRNA pseudouridine synthase 1, partial [Dinochytrium kinnereticum]